MFHYRSSFVFCLLPSTVFYNGRKRFFKIFPKGKVSFRIIVNIVASWCAKAGGVHDKLSPKGIKPIESKIKLCLFIGHSKQNDLSTGVDYWTAPFLVFGFLVLGYSNINKELIQKTPVYESIRN